MVYWVMNKFFSFYLLFLVLFSSQSVFAACTSPAGTASQTRYDFTGNKMYYCNDTDWIESGGGGRLMPTSIFNGSVSPTPITVSGITYPAYYVISSRAQGYESGGGNDRRCDFSVNINGSWIRLATKDGNGSTYFTANIINISATETFVQSHADSIINSNNAAHSGTWDGRMRHVNNSGCASVSASVVRLD